MLENMHIYDNQREMVNLSFKFKLVSRVATIATSLYKNLLITHTQKVLELVV